MILMKTIIIAAQGPLIVMVMMDTIKTGITIIFSFLVRSSRHATTYRLESICDKHFTQTNKKILIKYLYTIKIKKRYAIREKKTKQKTNGPQHTTHES